MHTLDDELDWHPARRPSRRVLHGELVILEPLDVRSHAAAIVAATSGPLAAGMWDYLGYLPSRTNSTSPPRAGAAASSDDPLFHAVVATSGDGTGGCAVSCGSRLNTG
jgi:hypothetical protein